MQITAQSWVVLTELTDESALAIGITMALQFAPPLLLVGLAGWLTDRFDHRKLLLITQAALAAISAIIGIMILAGALTLPAMFVLAGAFGVATALDNPPRQVYISDLVTRDEAQNAIALNATGFNVARLIGPAVAGIGIVIVGSGWVFVANALSFVATIVALLLIRPSRSKSHSTGSPDRLADGFRYVGRRPDLVVLFVSTFIIGAFGTNFAIYAPTMAREFGQDATGFGLLTSVFAIGSIAGALVTARRKSAKLRVVAAASLLFCAMLIVSALMPSYALFAVTLIGVGFALIVILITANGYVQTNTHPTVRGRVLALYLALLHGGTPLGAPIVGWIADAWGARASVLAAGVAGFVAASIIFAWFAFSGRIHRVPGRFAKMTLDATRPIHTIVEPAQPSI